MPGKTTNAISDYDLMVLVSFETKAEWEGDERYTYENWPPEFETTELNERAATYSGFMEILRENEAALTAWNDAHTEDACDLVNAHRDEERRRAEHAFVWGVRRSDGAVFPQRTREMAEWFLRPSPREFSFTLLHRDAPGGEFADFVAESEVSH